MFLLQTMLVMWQEEMRAPVPARLGPGFSLGDTIFLQPLPSASAFEKKPCTTHQSRSSVAVIFLAYT